MWIVIDVYSFENEDANGRYLIDVVGECDFTLLNISEFLEVENDEIEVVRIFNHSLAGDEDLGNLPTIYIQSDEIFFV